MDDGITHMEYRVAVTVIFTALCVVGALICLLHARVAHGRSRVTLLVSAYIFGSWSAIGVTSVMATLFGLLTLPEVTSAVVTAIALGILVFDVFALNAYLATLRDRNVID
jgi:hypothetical protein